MAKFRREPEKILDIDASMKGTLVFKDPVNLRINGLFEGNLEFKGTLTIGENADVRAEIRGERIYIEGKFKGKIESTQTVILRDTCWVEANIFTSNISIEEGAFFEGSIKMVKDILNIDELSKYLNISREKIEDWVATGSIPYITKENKILFDRNKIEEWLTKEKV